MTIDALAKSNFFKSTSLDDLKKLSIVTTRQDLMIESAISVKWFSPTEYRNRDSWTGEDFVYDISDLGLRGSDIPKELDMAAFGCSFTFGQGLPITKLWHHHVSNSLNYSCYNFGQPAGSIKSVKDIFNIVTQHSSIKHAVFLLPPYHRTLIAAKSKFDDTVSLVPIMPGYISNLENNFNLNNEQIYKALPDEEMLNMFKDNLYMIIHLAEMRGVKVYFSSWCKDTYEFMKRMELNDMLISQWVSSAELNNDFARDKMHPGPEHHKKWANEITSFIK